MNTFTKLFLRKPVFTVVLTLLLTFAVGFSCIGFAACVTAREQYTRIDINYITIALPTVMKWRGGSLSIDKDGNYHYGDGTFRYSLENVEAAAKNAPQFKRTDNSGFLGGVLTDMHGLPGTMFRKDDDDYFYDKYSCSFGVLALECIGVTDASEKPEGGTSTGRMSYIADFVVLGAPSLMEHYGDITGRYMRINESHGIYNDDLTVPFEVGKRYIVRGFVRQISYDDLTKRRYDEDLEKGHVRTLELDGKFQNAKRPDLASDTSFLKLNDLMTYRVIRDGALPFFAEYDGDWRDFLISDAGAVWRETIIPWTKLNQNSVSVVLTDNINATFNFNVGKALVMEGRAFSDEEYANGDDVCLASAAFAEMNGINVGDTVEIDCYDCGIEKLPTIGRIPQRRLTIMPSENIGMRKEYTVIGIYTAPEFEEGLYNFTADTIFAPKKSVPDAEKYENPEVSYLNATVIKNGQVEEFEKYMAEHGMGGYYRYFDMGFESAAPTLEALVANATRVIAIAMSLLVLVAAVGIYLTFMRMKPVIRSERLVGVKRGTVWCGISGVFSAVIGISVALGALLGALLYGNITKAIFETSVELNLPALIACAAGEFILLTAAAMLAAVPAASPNLMNSGRVKRKK